MPPTAPNATISSNATPTSLQPVSDPTSASSVALPKPPFTLTPCHAQHAPSRQSFIDAPSQRGGQTITNTTTNPFTTTSYPSPPILHPTIPLHPHPHKPLTLHIPWNNSTPPAPRRTSTPTTLHHLRPQETLPLLLHLTTITINLILIHHHFLTLPPKTAVITSTSQLTLNQHLHQQHIHLYIPSIHSQHRATVTPSSVGLHLHTHPYSFAHAYTTHISTQNHPRSTYLHAYVAKTFPPCLQITPIHHTTLDYSMTPLSASTAISLQQYSSHGLTPSHPTIPHTINSPFTSKSTTAPHVHNTQMPNSTSQPKSDTLVCPSSKPPSS